MTLRSSFTDRMIWAVATFRCGSLLPHIELASPMIFAPIAEIFIATEGIRIRLLGKIRVLATKMSF